jgi:saccharopine dehydrogenase (NAD+, L-lysine-forming)
LQFAIIGAGGVGKVIIRHLAGVQGTKVKVGDIDPTSLKEASKVSPRISTVKLDASSPDRVGRFIKGSDVVINASDPRFNLLIMKQAVKKGTHYVDLAGYPSEQLKQGDVWKKADLVAVLGMGEDPGLSNVLARRAVDMLDGVSEIRIRDGETSTSDVYPFVALFAPAVFLEEAVSPAHYFEGGEMKTDQPMSRREVYSFPPPLGEVPVYAMDHEEVHTLPEFLPKKPNLVDFKLALTDDTASAIRLFHKLGLLRIDMIRVGKAKVKPLSVLLSLMPKPSEIAGKIHGNAGILVEAVGQIAGDRYALKLYAVMTHEEAYEKYRSNATSYLTGTPTAVCALMLAGGNIENRGVIVPECLNAEDFLDEARKFAIQVQVEKNRLE